MGERGKWIQFQRISICNSLWDSYCFFFVMTVIKVNHSTLCAIHSSHECVYCCYCKATKLPSSEELLLYEYLSISKGKSNNPDCTSTNSSVERKLPTVCVIKLFTNSSHVSTCQPCEVPVDKNS